MSKIKDAFKNGKAFIPFLTGGDPDTETTEALILEMERRGADLIEIGVPFSDPFAAGGVIRSAAYEALRNGATLNGIIALFRSYLFRNQ